MGNKAATEKDKLLNPPFGSRGKNIKANE